MRLPPTFFKRIGSERGPGDLVALLPYVTDRDFRSRVDFTAGLDRLLTDARSQGCLNSETVVVFPHHVATPLYFADEWPWVYRSRGLNQALLRALLDEKAWHIARAGLRHGSSGFWDGLRAELIQAKAEDVARHVQAVFGHLARAYAVTIVTGAVALPDPRVSGGELIVDARRDPRLAMRSVALVFRPSGDLEPQVASVPPRSRFEARLLWSEVMDEPAETVIQAPGGAIQVGDSVTDLSTRKGLQARTAGRLAGLTLTGGLTIVGPGAPGRMSLPPGAPAIVSLLLAPR